MALREMALAIIANPHAKVDLLVLRPMLADTGDFASTAAQQLSLSFLKGFSISRSLVRVNENRNMHSMTSKYESNSNGPHVHAPTVNVIVLSKDKVVNSHCYSYAATVANQDIDRSRCVSDAWAGALLKLQ